MQQFLSPMEQLFQEDKEVIFNDDFYRRPDEFFDSLYEKILLLVSYDKWDARNVLQTGVWYYCYCKNTLLYRESDPNLERWGTESNERKDCDAYLALLIQHIRDNEKEVGFFRDLILEVASILHWKQMKIYADNEPFKYKDWNDDKEKILWFYFQPTDWEIFYITPEFNFSPEYLLLTEQNIKALEKATTRWSMVNDIEALLVRNYAVSRLLRTYIPHDELRSLAYESIENYLFYKKQENITEQIISSLKVAKYLLNTTTENRVNIELHEALQDRENLWESYINFHNHNISIDPLEFCAFKKSWLRKMHICNPSRNIYNLIFATICCLCPKYKPLYEYYQGKITFEDGIKYLSYVSKLPDIIANVESRIVKKYTNKYFYPEFLLEPQIITDDTYPRSIETIVSDLNIPEVQICDFTLPQDAMKRKCLGKNAFALKEVVVNALSKDISIFTDFINQIASEKFIEDSDDAKLLLSQIILGRELGANPTKQLTWYNDKGQFLGYLVGELYIKNSRRDFSDIYMKSRENLMKKSFSASQASTYSINCSSNERKIVDDFMAKCEALT